MKKLFTYLFAAIWTIISFNSYAQISSPLDVPNLAFWVDGKDINGTGIQPSNGSVVTTWVDKGLSGNNLTTVAGTVTFEETGFDGINPGLRFPITARMTASSPFSGNFQNEMTVFFINANETLTNNFSVNLNGTNIGSNIANGRFSFHTPFGSNNRVFFDAGACCGSTRLQGPFPNAVTETTLYTGLNDQPGNRQLLRIDGQAFAADSTGHNANVSGGIHIGDLPSGFTYDGRFAEVLIYDRALSLAEVQDVECFLLLKWKLSDAPAGCTVNVLAQKNVTVLDLPGYNGYALPGNDVIYTIRSTHESGPDLDAETVFIVDAIPSDVIFYNGDIDDGGPELNPVKFIDNGSGLTFDYATDVGFSNAATKPTDMAQCNYTPISGYDSAVTHICLKPSGSFNSGTPAPSFELSFRARIK